MVTIARAEVPKKHWRFLRSTDDSRFIVLYGGASSAKSWSVAAWLVKRLYEQDGIGILALRKTRPAVRKSCYRLVKHWLAEWGYPFSENKTELIITAPNGSFIQFDGLDDVDKMKSIEGINYVWLEEATEFDYRDFLQLHIRCRAHNWSQRNQLILTFNPVDPLTNMWLKDMTDQRPVGRLLWARLRGLHCTHTDNPFLSEMEHQAIEALADADEEYNKIYRLGEWALPTQIIYTNWDVVQAIPEDLEETGYGLDFGYVHPSALIWVGIREDHAYLRECLYESGLHNLDLIERMAEMGIDKEDKIVADSAYPSYIDEIADAGYNVHGVVKTPKEGETSSVQTGIDKVKRFKIHVEKGSENVIKEFKGYKWQVDRDGNAMHKPVKFRDDAMDAIRYFFMDREEEPEVVVIGEVELD